MKAAVVWRWLLVEVTVRGCSTVYCFSSPIYMFIVFALSLSLSRKISTHAEWLFLLFLKKTRFTQRNGCLRECTRLLQLSFVVRVRGQGFHHDLIFGCGFIWRHLKVWSLLYNHIDRQLYLIWYLISFDLASREAICLTSQGIVSFIGNVNQTLSQHCMYTHCMYTFILILLSPGRLVTICLLFYWPLLWRPFTN